MAITAAMVKELRERTGAAMMECKKALVEMDGDIETAIEHMRKTGLTKADKKAGRIAAEGLMGIEISADGKLAALVEVNCETDFVTKGDDFKGFVEAVTRRVLDKQPADVATLLAIAYSDEADTSVDETLKTLIAKVGENMNVRRFEIIKTQGRISSYMHGSRIAVLVDMEGGDDALGKDIAMHIAASRPVCVSDADVAPEIINKEKEIFTAQAAESGKPAEIIEKMIGGRIKKFLQEITLLGQPFIKEPDQTIEQLVKKAGASINSFVRYEVGEGIEKKQENFADEVMAQVKSS